MSTLMLIDRTLPSHIAKFNMPLVCMLPQPRLHWLVSGFLMVPGAVVEHRS